MDSRRSIWALVALLIMLQPPTSFANALDDSVLLRDIGNLLTDNSSKRLFTPKDLSALHSLLKAGDVRGVDQIVAQKAFIEVTINPEARVSVRRTAAPLPLFACGTAEPLLVRIVNEGHVTSSVNIRLRQEINANMVMLGRLTPRLTGATVEYRSLMMTVGTIRPVDLTLIADAGPGTDDLGLRSQLSMIVKC
jgi:hypothetical protein